jgi:hypothetical protein
MPTPVTPVFDRLFGKVDYDEKTRCLIFTGSLRGSGYGQIWMREAQRSVEAHRVAYELFVGAIPDGMQIDHLCRNKLCVNPAHLEVVTPRENTLRGLKGRMVTECVHGHPYDEANTFWTREGRRRCRECSRLRCANRYARLRQARAA